MVEPTLNSAGDANINWIEVWTCVPITTTQFHDTSAPDHTTNVAACVHWSEQTPDTVIHM